MLKRPIHIAGIVIASVANFGVQSASEWSIASASDTQILDLGISAHEQTGHSDWNTPVSMDRQGNIYVVFNDEQLRVVAVKVDVEKRISSGIVSTGVSNDPEHNTPSVAVDGDGVIHVWYDMHNDEMKLKKSAEPYRVNRGWLRESWPTSERYTYPAATAAANGDIYFTARRSRGGACQLFHYDISDKKWRSRGTFGQADGYTCYLPRPYGASDGRVHLSFQWSGGGPGRNRHVGSYAVYDPVDGSFSRADGIPYHLPISPRTAHAYQPREAYWESEFGISDHGLTINDRGEPLIVYNFFRGGRPNQRVIRLARWNGTGWVRSDLAGPESGIILGDAEIVNRYGRINVFYNDLYDRLAWKQSVDHGISFSPATILTKSSVSSPWLHVGPRTEISEEPVLICNTDFDTMCRVLFFGYDVH